MNIIKHLFISRGIKNTISRAVVVSKRFGITPRKMETRLNTYIDITKKVGCRLTCPITAVTLRRHPKLIRKLSQRGVEFAIHGHTHINCTELSLKEQTKHVEKAIAIFKSCQVPFKGFRSPYLLYDEYTLQAVSKLKLLYSSNEVVLWDIVDKNAYKDKLWSIYKKLLDLYNPKNAEEFLVLPKVKNGLVEIPVSLPDDEIIVDRLSIKDESGITKIWGQILTETYRRGELFTLQLHHERIPSCGVSLVTILERAREFGPSVWIATLGEIAEWWKEKSNFIFSIDQQGNGKYKINVKCSKAATVLVRNCKVNKPTSDWANGYNTIDDRDFTIESSIKPFIGVRPESSRDAISFLRSEGLIVEESAQSDSYGIYFDNLANFEEADEKPISEAIESSTAPLLRFWRWPNGAKSALAVTGDIDSITLIDFIMRLFGR